MNLITKTLATLFFSLSLFLVNSLANNALGQTQPQDSITLAQLMKPANWGSKKNYLGTEVGLLMLGVTYDRAIITTKRGSQLLVGVSGFGRASNSLLSINALWGTDGHNGCYYVQESLLGLATTATASLKVIPSLFLTLEAGVANGIMDDQYLPEDAFTCRDTQRRQTFAGFPIARVGILYAPRRAPIFIHSNIGYPYIIGLRTGITFGKI